MSAPPDPAVAIYGPERATPRRRLGPLLLAVVPGCGHFALYRYLQGALLFAMFACGADALLLSAVWEGEPVVRALRTSGLAAVVLALSASLAHIALLTVFRCPVRADTERRARLLEAHRAYVRGEAGVAEQQLLGALRAVPDRTDADLFFLLGAFAGHEGRHRRARARLRQCLWADAEGKWTALVARETDALRRGAEPTHRGAPLAAAPTPPPNASQTAGRAPDPSSPRSSGA